MARQPLRPIPGRPLTAILNDDVDLEPEDALDAHVASEPWHRIERPLQDRGIATHDDLTELAVLLNLPPTLLAFLVQAATDLTAGEGATRSYCGYVITGQPPADAYRDVIGGERARPVLRRLRNAQFVVQQSLKVEKTSGAYAAAAWLTWAMGAPWTAKRFAIHALRINPNQPLAGDVLMQTRLNVTPSWPRPR